MFARLFGTDAFKAKRNEDANRLNSHSSAANGGASATNPVGAATAGAGGGAVDVSPSSGSGPQRSHRGNGPNTRLLHPVRDRAEIARRLQVEDCTVTSVSIPQYRIKGSYVEYVVECTQGNACWRVFRRYQQFKALDQALRLLSARGTPNHGDYGVLPPLPGSHWMEVTNQSPELVDRRRRFLEAYLQQLLVPRNLFYVAHTALYGFLHDGEVPIDVKAVSVQPLLGLATMSELKGGGDGSHRPYKSPTAMSLEAVAPVHQTSTSSVTEDPSHTAPADTAGAVSMDEKSGVDGFYREDESPLRLENTLTSFDRTQNRDSVARKCQAAASASEDHLGGGAATDTAFARPTSSSPSSTRASTDADTATTTLSDRMNARTCIATASSQRHEQHHPSYHHGTHGPAATEKEEQEDRSSPSPHTNSMPELDEVGAWESDDVPSEEEEWSGSLSAVRVGGPLAHSHDGDADAGSGGRALLGRGGPNADERLPPPTPTCVYCNREFNSTLYPHRCFFCRARFCKHCMWHLRTGLGAAPPVVEAMASPKKGDKHNKKHASVCPGGGGGSQGEGNSDIVNACLQCTENYKRRWNRHNGAATAPATTSSQEQELFPPRRTDGGLSSSSLGSSSSPPPGQGLHHPFSRSSGNQPNADHHQPHGEGFNIAPVSAPLCTPSLRPVGAMTAMRPTALSSQSVDSASGRASGTSLLTGNRTQGQQEAAQRYRGKLSALATPAPMRVGLDSFQLLTCLGRGTFGKVIKVRLRATGTVYAMKVMNKSVVYRRYMTSYIKEEKSILLSLPAHPYIVRCHYAFQSDYYLFFILDYLPGGELYDLIYPVLRLTPQEAKLYAAELVLALEHLHNYDVVHRDIKPENVVLDKDGHVKLTDFGLARRNFSHTRRRSFVGSAEYVAPETIQGEQQTPALDWWSLGVLLYEMLAGQAPFHADNNNAVYENVMQKEPDFSNTAVFTPDARSLIAGLLTREVKCRLQDPDSIRAHPYFSDINWAALRAKTSPAPRVPYLTGNDVRHFKREFTSEWPSVSPPVQGASRNSIEMLHRCFDNFTVVRDRTLHTAEGREPSAAAAVHARGSLPPPLDLEGGSVATAAANQTSSLSVSLSTHTHCEEEEREGAGTGAPDAQLPTSLGNTSALAHHGQQDGNDDVRVSLANTLPEAHLSDHYGTRYTADDVLGVWRLLTVETCALDGRVIYPWGGDVVGTLTYLPTGDYAMQLSPLRRRRLRHRHIALASKEELRDIFCSYVAEFGTFLVPPPPPPCAVTQRGEGSGRLPAPLTPQDRERLPSEGDGATEKTDKDARDVFEASTALLLHRVEGNLCPNLAQRVTAFRFRTEALHALSPTQTASQRVQPLLSRQSQQQHHRRLSTHSTNTEEDANDHNSGGEHSSTAGGVTATSWGVGSTHVREQSADGNSGDSSNESGVILKLMTEPEVVANETFKARTVMTWVRCKAFASRSATVSPPFPKE